LSAKNICLVIMLLTLGAALIPALSAPARGESPDPVILRSVEITTSVENSYAITEIVHSYENTADDPSQIRFDLTIPERAFISNFSLTLGNSTYYAEILRNGEAREQYEDAVESGETAGIGEGSDSNTFSFSVNLKEQQTATASLRYEHHVPRLLDERSYELYLSSMNIRPEEFGLEIGITSDAGITGLIIEGYEGQITESWTDSHKLTLYMDEQDLIPSGDLTVRYTEDPYPVNGTFKGYYDDLNGDYYFMNILSPEKSEIGGSFSKDIIFVLDKSGSMHGDKMDQLKEAFGVIIDQLPDDDRFTLIMFDSNIHVYSEELLFASDTNKEDAIHYLGTVEAGGSTNLYDGAEKALEMLTYSESRVPIIVLLTDGMANAGAYTHSVPIREHIADKNTIYCPIFTLGFGTNVNFEFLRALSLENHAKAQQILIDQSAGEQIVNFYETISTTLLRQINVQYSGYTYDVFPESIPALYEGSEVIIVGKLDLNSIDGEITSTITARTPEGTREFIETYPVGQNDTQDPSVKRFWAFARIYYLMDELTMATGEDASGIIAQIEELSIDAHFAIPPYTSLFLSIDTDDDQGDGDSGENGDEGNDDGSGGSGSGSGSTNGGSSSSGSADSSNSKSYYQSTNGPQPGGSLGLKTTSGGGSGTKMDGGGDKSSNDEDAMRAGFPVSVILIDLIIVLSMASMLSLVKKRKQGK